MRVFVALLAALLVAGSSGQNLLMKDGREYVFETESAQSAGTMDVATHSSGFAYKMKTRIQVNGKTMNIQFEDIKFSQFNGAHEARAWPFDDTTYTDVPIAMEPFSVTVDDNGLFKSLVVPAGLSVQRRNFYKSWAAQLQLNTAEIRKGNHGFRSKEQLLQGKCDMTYTLASGAIRKSVVHVDDCEDRVYRIVDDYRGYRCDGACSNEGQGYPSSVANTVYLVKKVGDQWKIKGIVASGTWVAQFYEEEGSSQFVYANSTSQLVESKASSGDISPSGETITDLAYEWADAAYKWDVDRDLKAREPVLASGQRLEEDQATIRAAIKAGIVRQKALIANLDTDEASRTKAHKEGILQLVPAVSILDYDNLKGLAEELLADKSEDGVSVSNVYNELLAAAGTTAAALAVRDLVLENKFDTDRDAARVLTGVAFHIRRPNTQLVKEYESLLNADLPSIVKMTVPLTFGHLVRMTCERAGSGTNDETKRCIKEFASVYVNRAWERYTGSSSNEEKSVILASIQNMRWGGQSTVLKDLIDGKVDGDNNQLRSQALWAAGFDAIVAGNGPQYFLPIFANRENDHELRVAALSLLMHAKPRATDLATVLTVLYKETDYEVINYAYSLLERWSQDLNPCNAKTKDLAAYFLKFMKQYSDSEANFDFGVTRTWARQYYKKKFGYGGQYMFYVVGSKKSTTPISVGMSMNSFMLNKYQANVFGAHVRLEGVAKALVKKFKKTDPTTWKTADLQKILSGDMAIRERPDQPVRVSVTIMIKGVVAYHRQYDESSTRDGGRVKELVEKFKNLGDTYSINHQRAVLFGQFIYEQPSVLGIPVVSMSNIMTLYSLKATVKRGNHRGLLYRDVEYDINAFTQSNRLTFSPSMVKKASFGIVNDRIYHLRFPRKFVIGVNPIKKEFKLSVSRPKYDRPWRIFMHSATAVMIRGMTLKGDYASLQENCPQCNNVALVTRGPGAARTRAFVDRENEKRGSYLYGEYFDCEMNIDRGFTIRKALYALTPYNKQPKTLYTSISMGIRQIRTFLLLFPKTEQCGAQLRWSQSRTNPVKEIEVSIRGSVEKNGERMFFRGRKWFIKALIKAKGEPADRSYRINLAYEFTPGYLQNKLKVQLNRAPVPALNIPAYSVCYAADAKYPDFSSEFLDYDANNDMKVSGKALLQYGEGTTCSEGEGEIKVNFEYSTTQAARDDLKDKWYYKQCMAQKNRPGWSGRSTLPLTEACYATVFDATSARRYKWDVNFVKLTPRLKSVLSKVQSALKAGLLPYWDVDPEEVGVDGEIGPFLNVDVTLKNDDKSADVVLNSRVGEEKFDDVPLRLNWSKRLRNLKFTRTLKKLFEARIINPCTVTKSDVRTMDNVTYAYEPSNCWTLASGNCGPTPAYAVFTKTSGESLPLAARIYIGGHLVELTPSGSSVNVAINGNPVSVGEDQQAEHTVDGVEIFKIFRWGSSYHVYSFLRVWVTYDGHFVETVPAPSTKGQHCGLCGNYNRNQFDEFTGKNEQQLKDAAAMVNDWKWNC